VKIGENREKSKPFASHVFVVENFQIVFLDIFFIFIELNPIFGRFQR
jgi:hypothetical protein